MNHLYSMLQKACLVKVKFSGNSTYSRMRLRRNFTRIIDNAEYSEKDREFVGHETLFNFQFQRIIHKVNSRHFWFLF